MAVLLFADGQNNKRLFSYFLAKGEFLSPFKRSQIVHASIVDFIRWQKYIGLLMLFAFDYKIKPLFRCF